MKRCNLRLSLVALAMAALLGAAAFGCAPAKPAAPAVPAAPAAPAAITVPTVPSAPPAVPQAAPPASIALPAVNYFAVSSDNVPPNSIIILVWSVSGVDSASIDNGIGNVAVKGRYALLPLASTTFVLTATNAAGSVTAQATVQVSDSAAISGYRPSYTIPRVQQSTTIGSPFTIKLEAQPSKGYTWVVDYYDQAVLSLTGSDYQAYGPPPRGSDGQQQFTFRPLDQPGNNGNTRILVSNVNDQTPTKFDSIIYDINIRQK
jgi:hypothetical protein